VPPIPFSIVAAILSSDNAVQQTLTQLNQMRDKRRPTGNVPFPARLKRHGKSLPRMTAAALTLSENARLP
ncbi:hypothetical protein, partial [Pseudomonas aeruginosa]|uniref:hypothetical protein n=1 Tax=Pseudomonas aeruginosa TaxID=287 RepID=UPI003CEE75E8